MEESERLLLFLLLALVALRFGRQLAASFAPVVVDDAASTRGDAGSTARAAAERRLYSKGGVQPGSSRLNAALSLLVAIAACLPAWWMLTEARRPPKTTRASCHAERSAVTPLTPLYRYSGPLSRCSRCVTPQQERSSLSRCASMCCASALGRSALQL